MTDDGPFVDLYDILAVDWECDAKTLEIAYRHLAKLYHPDHPETADVTRFNEVIEAYRTLRNPEQRAEYDLLYIANTDGVTFRSPAGADGQVDEQAPLTDAEIHAKTLRMLYKRRREHALDPGVGPFAVQEMLGCTDEHFEFHVWYLKAKGWIETTEVGTLAITIDGIDHVIASSQTARAEKLRIAQSEPQQPLRS